MKTNRILLVAALGGMLLGGCTRDEGFRDTPNGGAVNFTAGIAAATRTTGGGDAWVAGDAVGICMVTNGGNITAAADVLADNVQYNVADAATGELSPASGTPIYYPLSGTVDFIAYYPYGGTVTAGVYNIGVAGQTSEAAQNALDVLYAKTTGMSKADPAVSLEFGHVLSKVTLDVKAGTGIAAADISDLAASAVAFGGIPVTATLDLQDGALTAGTGPAQTFNPLKNTTPQSGFDASFTALLVPQPDGGTGRTLKFTVGGQTYTWPIPDAEKFEAGVHYIYPVTVNKTAITVGTVTITDWNTNDNGTGTAEQIKAKIVAESNSYMVEPNGMPILIPVSQANKAADPDYNLGADATGLGGVEAGNFTVELVWGDLPVGADGVIQEIKAYYEFVYVKPGVAGNAVICIKVGNVIKWSWHIWVTEPVASATDTETGLTWMDRNLGAKSNTPFVNGDFDQEQWVKTLGLFYQWGRKDALPGSDGTLRSGRSHEYNNQTYYTGSNTTGTTDELPTGEYTELPALVQNPLTFAMNHYAYRGSLNMEGEDNDSWGGVSGAKTLYDPCPAGWRVPENGKWSGSSSYYIREFNAEWSVQTDNGRVFNGVDGTSSLGLFFPAIGYRNPSSGALYSIGSYGYYWSGTPYTDTNARFQSFYGSMVHLKAANLRTYGFAVRCVAE